MIIYLLDIYYFVNIKHITNEKSFVRNKMCLILENIEFNAHFNIILTDE